MTPRVTARIVPWKFGIASGITAAIIVFFTTLFSILKISTMATLLQYSVWGTMGYKVTLMGAFYGAVLGFVYGFVITYIIAFIYNFMIEN